MILSKSRFWLAGVVAVALLLRIVCIGWGLPPSIPHVADSDIRSSYAFDEDDALTAVSFTAPASFDFDFRLYDWGTLHFWLLLGWLEAAQATGYIGYDWRQAYYQMVPLAFERVYRAGRLLSVAEGGVLLVLVYLLGRDLLNRHTGIWAAALTAASPAHLLSSVQVRVDMTMVVLVTLIAWLGMLALNSKRASLLLLLGMAAGLATSAKYPAAIIVAPVLLVVLWYKRNLRFTILSAAGCIGGLLIGQPHFLFHSSEIVQQLQELLRAGQHVPEEFDLELPQLIAAHAGYVFRFLIGPAATVLAAVGLFLLVRRRRPEHFIVLAAVTGCMLTWIPLQWPLLRYQLPVLPFLAVSAAFELASIRQTWRAVLGIFAVAFPLAASIAQSVYMRTPHPANRALAVVLERVPPGTDIARMAEELPPLDRKVYPMGPNPLLDDISSDPPAWVLTADLAHREHPATTLDTLRSQFETIANFESPRVFAWSTFGEYAAPHDWKYTHPRLVLYRRLR